MSNDDSFTVTVLGYLKHNSTKKKGHTHVLLSTRFFDDAKVLKMNNSQRLVYLYLLCRCGDEVRETVDSCARHVRQSVNSRTIDVRKILLRLEELQLVSVDISSPLLERKGKEEKRKEEKRIPAGSKNGPPPAAPELLPSDPEILPSKPKSNIEVNRSVWEQYCASYLTRWKVEPTRNAKVNSAIANFVKRVGDRDAAEIIKFFLTHNDQLYLKTQHDISLALRDAESLRTQWLRGKAVTMRDVREFERKDHYQQQLSKIEKGEI